MISLLSKIPRYVINNFSKYHRWVLEHCSKTKIPKEQFSNEIISFVCNVEDRATYAHKEVMQLNQGKTENCGQVGTSKTLT